MAGSKLAGRRQIIEDTQHTNGTVSQTAMKKVSLGDPSLRERESGICRRDKGAGEGSMS